MNDYPMIFEEQGHPTIKVYEDKISIKAIGCRSLIVTLMNLNLIDEFQLCVHPIIVRSGGELGLKLGRKDTKLLKAGESYTVEPLSLHSFFNPTNKENKFNVKIRQGHTGFENSLRILYGLAGDRLTYCNYCIS